MRAFRVLSVPGIALSPDQTEDEAFEKCKSILQSAGLGRELRNAAFSVAKRSVDARVRNGKRSVRLVYTVRVRFEHEVKWKEELLASHQMKALPLLPSSPLDGIEESAHERATLPARPLVVGMGPAGLFAALLLAEQGYRPILIDRGDDVKTRIEKKNHFMKTGELDCESNVQFGAGGAGTFSDGKLITRISDPYCLYALQRLVEFGAPAEILTEARPHIGTDLLVSVVDRILSYIAISGGEVLYRTRLDRLREDREGVTVADTTRGEIPTGALLLAIGHSARDTAEMLLQQGFPVEPKPFSVGVRIEHLQSEIDRAMYGDLAGHPNLPHAEYNLSDTTGERGVYTFCMCPGGEVVAASSESGGLVVNGMSNHARDGKNAVAATCVSVLPDDVGGRPEDGIAFLRSLEERAFALGGGNYSAPIETLGDFMGAHRGIAPSDILPTYTRKETRIAPLREIFPPKITEALQRGFSSFGRKLSGFDTPSAVLTAVESRTSSPVRILRTEAMTAVGFPNIYPIGEGAGYAGGITSAAVDGIRAAVQIIERFLPCEEQ